MGNLFTQIPHSLPNEICQDLVATKHVRIERVLSQGQASPDEGWYDQHEHEWVLVLEGYRVIEFEDGRHVTLKAGDYLLIKAHEKHRVVESDSEQVTVWLAVFYR